MVGIVQNSNYIIKSYWIYVWGNLLKLCLIHFTSSNATSSEDVRPGLLFNRGLKRAHEIYKKKEVKKLKPLKQDEKDLREEGLGTAISTENKGFKLLERMGFKAGEGLGRTGSGLKEPINIVVRQGTSGLGRESHQQELLNKRREMKYKRICDRENKFRITNREKKRLQLLRGDFFNAQRVCEELDYRIVSLLANYYYFNTYIV